MLKLIYYSCILMFSSYFLIETRCLSEFSSRLSMPIVLSTLLIGPAVAAVTSIGELKSEDRLFPDLF